MMRLPQDEAHELQDDHHVHSGRTSLDVLEGESLLPGAKSETAWKNGDALVALPWWRRHIWFTATSTALLFGFTLAVILMNVHDAAWHRTGPSVEKEADVSIPDYELTSGWDFNAPPQRREYEFTIRDHVYNPDGIFRPMMLVNNQFPGPLIEVNEGDTIIVRVNNRAVNGTSIHWHGIYQNGTTYMDGTTGVTQCPIAPGGSFTYEFTVAGQSGTYWWHGHVGLQASDGLYGPLIVHARNEREMQKLDYDSDRVILIGDHYHDLSGSLLWQYLKPDMENAEPVPVGGLINGQSIRNCDDFLERKCDNTTENAAIPNIHLDKRGSHRLRIVNVGAFAEFQVQVDEHELAITEVDGTDVLPVEYHRININPAQRYSVILTPKQGVDASSSYWLRARMITRCFTDPPTTMQPEALAIVRYGKTEAKELPHTKDWEEMLDSQCRDMNTSDLHPVTAIAAPEKPDAFFYLRSNFEIGAYRLSRGFFNSSSWSANIEQPSLERLIRGQASKDTSLNADQASTWINDQAFDVSDQLSIQSEGIQTIDLLISNFDDGNHPMHLHGYKYFVLAQGHGHPLLTSPGAEYNINNLAPLYSSLDLSNPLRRDTASVEAFGWILIRFVADNPGAWLFHCHIGWHSEAGLAMQFLTRTDGLSDMTVPDELRQLCAAEGLGRGSGPKDEDYRDLAR